MLLALLAHKVLNIGLYMLEIGNLETNTHPSNVSLNPLANGL